MLTRKMVDTVRCLSYEDLTEDFYEKLLMGAINKKLDHLPHQSHTQNIRNEDDPPALQPRQHEQGLGLNTRDSFPAYPSYHRPHEADNGRYQAQPNRDPGQGPSSGHSLSDPEITTRRSIGQSLSQPVDADRYGSHNYTPSSIIGKDQPPRIPSPRVSSFPAGQPPVPNVSLLRSSTEQVGPAHEKGKWPFGHRK